MTIKRRKRTNYNAIEAAVRLLDDARRRYNFRANLRLNIDTERAEIYESISALQKLVRAAIANGCRESKIKSATNGEFTVSWLIDDLIYERARKQCGKSIEAVTEEAN